MTLKRFLQLCDEALAKKGLPISIRDLPDVDFYNYFNEDFTEEEARHAAEELILCESDNLGITEELLDF